MQTTIVGMGEVGKGLYQVLAPFYPVTAIDKDNFVAVPTDILHICFPCNFEKVAEFIGEVKKYQSAFKPKYTIIHSTVPVGTSRACNAIHSPIRGMHPYMDRSIRTFLKMLGGEQASEVADYFRRAELSVLLYDKQEETEAAKLFDTEYYRVCLEFVHRVKKYCDEKKLSFHNVYTLPNLSYNAGYNRLGKGEYMRPVLQPIMTKIGGHCVMQNKELISLSEENDGIDEK